MVGTFKVLERVHLTSTKKGSHLRCRFRQFGMSLSPPLKVYTNTNERLIVYMTKVV